MADVVIAVENVSKQYRLGTFGSNTLRADAARWWAQMRGRPDPTLRIGMEEQARRQGERMWALRDVSFEVKAGEVVGIIGRNGAGKSTLLKILSRITAPTTGAVKVKGRIGSLLEVGTGFHPELTGRENIYLNGAILGMKKAEIARKFDEIVDFSGVEEYIDTPVKRYSSGMYVRLAFAVAAHLEPEILLVDEVLAVGDAEFQKKCLGKMGEVAHEGRTVLFVSHNMAAVESLCPRSVLVSDGVILCAGGTKQVVDSYLHSILPTAIDGVPLQYRTDRSGNGVVRLTSFHVEDAAGFRIASPRSGMDVSLVFSYTARPIAQLRNVDIGLSIQAESDQMLAVLYSSYHGQLFSDIPENGSFRCTIERLPLSSGRYRIGARVLVNGDEADWPRDGVSYLDVEAGDFYRTGHKGFEGSAPILMDGKWQMQAA